MMARHSNRRSFHSARRWSGWALGAAAIVAASPLAAATCSLSAQGVNFGNYDFQSSQPLDGVGHVIVTCDVSTSYTIALSPGAGSFTTRVMQNGVHLLSYNLYTDLGHSTVWGDGSGGNATLSGSGTNGDYPVYGSAPAGQNPYVGSYNDAITVTLSF